MGYLCVFTPTVYPHPGATAFTFQTASKTLLLDHKAEVYVYKWRDNAHYPTVVGVYQAQSWLVMFSLDGIMETAFPPDNAEAYLANSQFTFVDTIEGLLR